ncbi:hypothetical protein [Pareuzebyella sediminis]|uniref:hypothetical protein n=1 Tax=Pareuzebyella sediminis TaxID=2607998 RepID=UPI001E643F31|nr:hypothetical protein [Pareuzebyella sediminis]
MIDELAWFKLRNNGERGLKKILKEVNADNSLLHFLAEENLFLSGFIQGMYYE